jgi:hypothetical protein
MRLLAACLLSIGLFLTSTNASAQVPPPIGEEGLKALMPDHAGELAKKGSSKFGKAMLVDVVMPPGVIARFQSQKPQKTSNLEEMMAADGESWQGSPLQFEPINNPITFVITVVGYKRDVGEAALLWGNGLADDGGKMAGQSMPMATEETVAVGERVVFTRQSSGRSVKDPKQLTPVVTLVSARNFQIEAVRVQVWSGFPSTPWYQSPFLQTGAPVGVVMIVLWYFFFWRNRYAGSADGYNPGAAKPVDRRGRGTERGDTRIARPSDRDDDEDDDEDDDRAAKQKKAASQTSRRQAVMNQGEFTDYMRAAISATRTSGKVGVTAPLQLDITENGNTLSQIDLVDSYNRYREDPSSLMALVGIVAKGGGSSSAAAAPSTEGGRDLILPVIRTREQIAQMQEELKQRGSGDFGQQPVSARINDELVMTFASGEGYKIKTLTQQDVLDLRMDADELQALAVANFARFMRDRKSGFRSGQGDAAGVFKFSLDELHESSLMVVASFWRGSGLAIKGAPVAFPAARDVLFVTGSEDAVGLKLAAGAAAKAFEQATHPLSKRGFKSDNGQWIPL